MVDETLAVHQVLLNSKPPAPTTVKAMRDWLLDLNSGKARPSPQLFDSSKKRLDDPNDLVALCVPADQDRLSEFILSYFGPLFKVFLSSLLCSEIGTNQWFSRQKNQTATRPAFPKALLSAASRYLAVSSSARSPLYISCTIHMLCLECWEDGLCCSQYA